MRDVINALEEVSRKKYANSGDKKFMINAGDKYLLEKLFTHAQDRVCALNKFEETNKGTRLFKADELKQAKNAPLNILINTIKNAPIEKDSKIDLRGPNELTSSLIDSDVAIQSAVADNLNQLSTWVKKVKAQGPKCLASIKSKDFANKTQAYIQGCNFGHFIDTLSQENVNNLESVLHFINANEKLLNNPAAKAETSLDELKLEGFISKTFDNLGSAIRCAQLDPANSGDKKVFIRNLPYDERSNIFDTSGIICKSNNKILGVDSCKKQFDLSSDRLGRGLEIKPKKGAISNVTFSVKDSDNCSDISFKDPKTTALAVSAEQCTAQLKDGSAFVWDIKNNKCSEVEIAKISSIEQCMAMIKEGSVFNWDAQKKSCGEFSALLTENVIQQAAQQCIIQKKNGYAYKWDSAKKSCDETPTIAGTKLESKIACDAKAAANLPYKWNAIENTCESSPVLTAIELKAKKACDMQPSRKGFSNSWDNQTHQCNQFEISKVSSIEQCVALTKPGSVFNWDAQKKSCAEFSSLIQASVLTQAAQQCEVKGSSYKWNSVKKECDKSVNDHSSSAHELKKITTIEQCVALTKPGSVFNWNSENNSCEEGSALKKDAIVTQTSQQCTSQKKYGYEYKWDSSSKSCSELPTMAGTKLEAKIACDAKTSAGFPYNWNSSKLLCERVGLNIDDSRSPAVAENDLKNPGLKNNESKISGHKGDPKLNDSTQTNFQPAKNNDEKSPLIKPITLTNEETKTTPKNSNTPVIGSKGSVVSNTDDELAIKPNKTYEIPKTKSTTLVQLDNSNITDSTKVDNIDSTKADNKNDNSLSNLPKNISAAEATKAQRDCLINSKEGYSWDSVKEICSLNLIPTPEMPTEEAISDKDEKQCNEQNQTWIDNDNEGRPGIRFEWDESKKVCIDKRADKDVKGKPIDKASAVVEEAPSAPKRAPARFTPINIPSRQIYLMPGMP
jgi:hypothetical protein